MSFVLGIMSALAGFLTGIIAIVFGVEALRRIKRRIDSPAGRGYAKAGLILGLVLSVLGGPSFAIIDVVLFSGDLTDRWAGFLELIFDRLF